MRRNIAKIDAAEYILEFSSDIGILRHKTEELSQKYLDIYYYNA